MVALARYFQLEILHAHTNASPSFEHEDWYSHDCADSMLVARKKYKGAARIIDVKKYRCVPADHEKLKDGMRSFEEYIQERSKRDDNNAINQIEQNKDLGVFQNKNK